MEEGLSTALSFLAYTCVILFTIITVFLILLIKELIDLAKSYKQLSDTVQREIKPTLEEIKKALDGINGLATGVDKQLTAVRDSFGTAYNVAYNATSKLKGAAVSLFKGLFSGLKLFINK